MSILIFANGDLEEVAWLTPFFEQATVVIAADGGANHLLKAGQIPNFVIGDLDSLDSSTINHLKQKGTQIVQFPAEKDETDLELALTYAVRHFETEILVMGVLGGRLDQTMANILLLAHPALKHRSVRLVEKYQQAWLISDEEVILGEVGDKISLIPLGGNTHILYAEGLKWPLTDELLVFGPARGVSNVITAVPAKIKISGGQLLCIHTQKEWNR